jgi:hypothetical protein
MMRGMKRPTWMVLSLLLAADAAAAPRAPLRFEVRAGAGLARAPLDGRLFVILAAGAGEEPRLRVGGGDATAQIFGVDVDGWAPGKAAVVEGNALGYPVTSLAALPPGEYTVQAVLHRYETFRRSDGHTVKLPPDRGEGQHWNLAPGNLVSTPKRVRIDPAASGTIALALDRELPPLPSGTDTPYLRHVKFKSELLSKFWGRDTFMGALVLLPEGFESHPQAHYPLVLYHSHFGAEIDGYRGTPPADKLPPPVVDGLRRECSNGHGKRCDELGYARMVQEAGWRFHQTWVGPGFPRVILVQIQHANPYYDDSYAVNSENLGPYGDAITQELVPYLEKTYRGLGPVGRVRVKSTASSVA